MTVEIISWSISTKDGTGPGSNSQPLDLQPDSYDNVTYCPAPILRLSLWPFMKKLLSPLQLNTCRKQKTVLSITWLYQSLTLNAPIATKLVCFSRLLKCLRSLYVSMQTVWTHCSRSTLFASILNLSVMLGNYLQQTTSADDIFRCIFSCRFKG